MIVCYLANKGHKFDYLNPQIIRYVEFIAHG